MDDHSEWNEVVQKEDPEIKWVPREEDVIIKSITIVVSLSMLASVFIGAFFHWLMPSLRGTIIASQFSAILSCLGLSYIVRKVAS